MARLERLMRDHFVEYASYFILDRAIPELLDGLKPVQRRLLYTMFRMNDGRYHKVANVIGETMKLHPHGDAAIGDALVVLANKDYFVDRQGNFGNILTGHPAAAARYIEARLTPLALETLFNDALTEFAPSYDGRATEPVALPCKLPVALMLGTEGIAVGMSTRILPHNLVELWEGQIAILEGRKFQLFPDFPQGGAMDVSAYDDGAGKVEVRARIEVKDPKRLVIEEIPYGTTTDSLIASIEAAAQKGRVKVASISDFTTDEVEIELSLPRGVDAKEVLPQLYAYTDSSVTVNSNLTIVDDRKPVQLTVTEVLEALTVRLRELLKRELEYERDRLTDRQHWLTLEQIFVEERVYQRIEQAETAEAVRSEVWDGMHEYEERFVRPMVDDDVTRLLDIRIRRISAYDIERNRKEIEEVVAGIKSVNRKLRRMTQTTIAYLRDLIDRYGEQFPRRTRIQNLKTIDKKAVARQNIKLAYDKETGFFGSEVRGDQFKLSVSEYDLVLAISNDGSYRIMPPVDRVLLPGRVLHCERFDPEQGADFCVVYRDKKRTAFAKRIHIEKFIRNKEYHLIKDKAGKIDALLPGDQSGEVRMDFVPAPRQRVKKASFDLGDLEVVGTTARGTRLAPKPVSRIKVVSEPAKASARKGAAGRSKRGGSAGPSSGRQGDLF